MTDDSHTDDDSDETETPRRERMRDTVSRCGGTLRRLFRRFW